MNLEYLARGVLDTSGVLYPDSEQSEDSFPPARAADTSTLTETEMMNNRPTPNRLGAGRSDIDLTREPLAIVEGREVYLRDATLGLDGTERFELTLEGPLQPRQLGLLGIAHQERAT